MRIAILEDDPSHRELLTHWLRLASHQTYAFEHGAQLLRVLEHESFDALLLDWSLPEMNGIEVLRQARERLHSHIPIIFVTAHDREDDVVAALSAGADEFLSKPLRRRELLARLEALGRRAIDGPPAAEVFEVGPFRLDTRSRSITRDNEPLALTSKDFDLASL